MAGSIFNTNIARSCYDAVRLFTGEMDATTGLHSIRILLLIQHCLKNEPFKNIFEFSDDEVEIIAVAASLHDLGKNFIPLTILNASRKLTDEEFAYIKCHPEYGFKVLEYLGHFQLSGLNGEFQQMIGLAKVFTLSHHERWDGNGYPNGLEKDNTPSNARLAAIIDVYNALVSERPYKDPFPHGKAVCIVEEGRETQFDPEFTDAFLMIEQAIEQVSQTPAWQAVNIFEELAMLE